MGIDAPEVRPHEDLGLERRVLGRHARGDEDALREFLELRRGDSDLVGHGGIASGGRRRPDRVSSRERRPEREDAEAAARVEEEDPAPEEAGLPARGVLEREERLGRVHRVEEEPLAARRARRRRAPRGRTPARPSPWYPSRRWMASRSTWTSAPMRAADFRTVAQTEARIVSASNWTGTPQISARRPKSALPRWSPASVPPLHAATTIASGGARTPAAICGLELLDGRGVSERAELVGARLRDHVRAPSRLAHVLGQPDEERVGAVHRLGRDEHGASAEERREEQIAVRRLRRGPAKPEHAAEPEARGEDRSGPGAVRLERAHRDQGVRALLERVVQEELELPRLVAALGEPREVVPLDAELEPERVLRGAAAAGSAWASRRARPGAGSVATMDFSLPARRGGGPPKRTRPGLVARAWRAQRSRGGLTGRPASSTPAPTGTRSSTG